MLKSGLLPVRGGCLSCGSVSAELIPITIDCEYHSIRESGGFQFLILPLLFFTVFLYTNEKKRVEILGRDTELSMPAELCGRCRSKVDRAKPFWWRIAALFAVLVSFSLFWISWWLVGFGIVIGLGIVVKSRKLQERARQKRFLKLLSRIPIYSLLLSRYPKARVARER